MRILILGGDGMLGHQLLKSFQAHHEVKVTLRSEYERYAMHQLFDKGNAFFNIDVRKSSILSDLLDSFKPEILINAVGIVKQADEANSHFDCIEINALLPHRLALICREKKIKLIQISTDCVFSGMKGHYDELDVPDPQDLYGRTKLLGEVQDTHCLTLRTSIIGLELHRKKSLIEWFLGQRGDVSGYRKAIYSGLTTLEFARVIENIVSLYPEMWGVWHVASEAISKYDLLSLLATMLNTREIRLLPNDSFVCDRSLDGSRFNVETGYLVPKWESMLIELKNDICQKYPDRFRG